MRSRLLLACLCVVCLAGPASGLAQGKGRQSVVAPDQRGTSALPASSPRDQHASASTETAIVPEYRLTTAGQESSLVWDTARMGLSLALVLLLLAVGVKVVRRWPGLTSRDTSAGALQVLGRLPLTAKEAICLVRVGSEVLVVGVSPAGVNLLHRLEGGVAEATRPAVGGTNERREVYSGNRLRELTAKIRDVQAAWGLGSTDRRGDR
jgi:flagellar biosynthetic protein FliO